MSKGNQKSTRFATLARIQRTHGKHGEVSLRPLYSFELTTAILELCPVWLIPPPLENRFLHTESVRATADRLLVHFEGITDKTAARALVGCEILVEKSHLSVELLADLAQEQNDYIDEDSYGLGLEIHSDNYGQLGRVTEVIETGANLVWVVDGGPYDEVLLPVIDDCVLEVDFGAGTARVEVMKGLIDPVRIDENAGKGIPT